MKAILQVEDNANDAFLFQHAMETINAVNPVHLVTDGQEAIDYLKGVGKFADRAQFPLPTLVLLDLKLPHVMGLDVLKWIRQESGLSLVVVVLTASSEEVDIVAAYHLGANAFLVKPSEASKFLDMVNAIRDFWVTHNTLPISLTSSVQQSEWAHTRGRSKRLPTGNGAHPQTPPGHLHASP